MVDVNIYLRIWFYLCVCLFCGLGLHVVSCRFHGKCNTEKVIALQSDVVYT